MGHVHCTVVCCCRLLEATDFDESTGKDEDVEVTQRENQGDNHALSSTATSAPTTGPDVAARLVTGTRVTRGPDWKWGDQVSNPPFSSSAHIQCTCTCSWRGVPLTLHAMLS